MKEYYSIKELVKEFNITARTLRYYEDERLIQPIRDGQKRYYTQIDYNRIEYILRARRLNFSIADIHDFINNIALSKNQDEKVQRVLKQIDEWRSRLKTMRQDIAIMLKDLENVEENSFERLVELNVKH